ncbi:DNA repair photolyase [Allocatelliglobosispora scoriae]|uniref:DNA repair photolyase n=1 Tax=Allocatelliglobosispora scoriae TaxID=643052 RepID=A0A841BQ49_9ACTN|nr:intein-containing Rv2578c family radical SAM protein [Allocatelliglobosispora scoriae]MBB5869498.1 DNA repair photolyase [Allocatelliglobosispora scoriae]
MRWNNLRTAPGTTAGPGVASTERSLAPRAAARPAPPLSAAQLALSFPAVPDAVVRTFDTPGFAGMTFYEIHAKSIINRVSGESSVPFQWTVNPYRGCTHACTYCLAGDTPILMADGRTKPLSDLRPGDRIYGTRRHGAGRRYVRTRVIDHWQTTRAAFRVTLADGTALTCGGDHRFLTADGWRYASPGPTARPVLAVGDVVLGPGGFPTPPKDSPDYHHGYLRAMIRGIGTIGATSTSDPEVIERTAAFLADLTTDTLTEWAVSASDDWCAGFLAGVFDAEGSFNRGTMLLASADPETVYWTEQCLARFGFRTDVEWSASTLSRWLRITGGLSEQVRFLLTTDPASSRKRSLASCDLDTPGTERNRVVAVEALGLDLPLFDITTGTGDYIANGTVSHNCFARNTHTYLDLDAGRDFDTKVVVKVNAGELLRRELAAPRWSGAPIAMGTNVDCYQRAEGRYGLMRPIIATLRDFANPFSILTKGTLILRDLDLLRQAAEVTEVNLAVSIGFVDEELWRSVEPGAPSPRRRLDVVSRLADAGFSVGVLMAPILPGLTDTDESVDATVAALAAAGASHVVPLPLHLRTGAKEWFAQWLRREHPELLARYRELYGDRAYLGKDYQREILARVRTAGRRHGIGAGGDSFRTARRTSVPAPPPEQLSLL